MSGQTPFYSGPMDKQMGMLGTGIHPMPNDRAAEEARIRETWRRGIEQAATQGSRLMTLPSEPRRAQGDSTAMKVLRVITYVLVIVTCLALLFTMVEMYLFVDKVQTALQEWANTFNTPGLIGE